MTAEHILDFYTQPGPMTTTGEHTGVFDELPDDVAAVATIVQGLLLHEHWAEAYGQNLSAERRSTTHLRSSGSMVDRLLANGSVPLSTRRPVEERVVGTCRNFTVLFVAILRAGGIPARARCGFGAYFVDGLFVDHWVGEYWHAAEQRWVMVDAQIDDFQHSQLPIDFDVLDVPRDRFIIAGDAWEQCRTGKADPATFGIMEMYGLWFIAGNVMRDLAALNKVEMLPWDDWGVMPGPDDLPDADLTAFIDQIAALTREPDANFTEMVQTYADDRLRVPDTVHNAILNRPEAVLTP